MISVDVFNENIELPYKEIESKYVQFIATKTIEFLELKNIKTMTLG